MVGPVFDSLSLLERSIATLVERSAQQFGDRTYLETASGSLTFAELPSRAGSVGAGLEALGVEQGGTVASILPNCHEFALTLFGAAWSNRVLVPLGTDLKWPQLHHRLANSGCSAVVAHHSALPELMLAVDAGLPQLSTVVVVGGEVTPAGIRTVTWDDFIDHQPMQRVPTRFDDVLLINYTSGTTGPSKGVVTTHHHVYCASVPLVDGFEWTADDVLWTALPLNHAAGLYHVLLPALAVGARAVVAPRFSLSTFWKEVVDAEATYAQIIGTMANLLMSQPQSSRETTHRLRSLTCFPAPVDPAEFERRFDVRLNTQAWGMTEVYPNQPTLNQARKGATCIGRPSALFDVRIIDENEEDVAADGVSVGEIIVRPRLPSSMIREYFGDAEATVAATRNLWFHTGDRATMDEEGYMHFVGRSKDMIRRRGENVSAHELEQAILGYPGVVQVAAYGVPAELGEEDIKVDLVVDESHVVDPSVLVSYLRERLPRFMVPRYVTVREELPLTPSGRVEKYRLKADPFALGAYDSGSSGRATAPPQDR